MKLNLIILSIMLSACSTSSDNKYYILSPLYTAQAKPVVANDWKIIDVKIPELLDRPQIVIKSGNNITLLEYNRWAAPVDTMITNVLQEDITGRSTSTQAIGEHQISITIDEFSADDNGQVTLRASWITKSGEQKQEYNFMRQEVANSSDVDSVINTMNHQLSELADAISTDNSK